MLIIIRVYLAYFQRRYTDYTLNKNPKNRVAKCKFDPPTKPFDWSNNYYKFILPKYIP